MTELEQLLLDFEANWHRFDQSKDEAIRLRFNISPTAYHQQLNALLDNADALAYNPLLIKRLRRLRARRRAARTG